MAMEQPSSRLVPMTVPAAYEHVVQRIRRMITLGEVLPEEHLPTERALAESFEVSRVTVREALRILQGEGLIESRRGLGGARVLGPAHNLAECRLRLRAEYDQMRENHEFRLAVEPMTAFLAAKRRDADDIRRMKDANERIGSAAVLARSGRQTRLFTLVLKPLPGTSACRRQLRTREVRHPRHPRQRTPRPVGRRRHLPAARRQDQQHLGRRRLDRDPQRHRHLQGALDQLIHIPRRHTTTAASGRSTSDPMPRSSGRH
jgi:hypothetical protein